MPFAHSVEINITFAFLLLSVVVGNELFLDTLDCYSCRDKAINGSCSDPFNTSAAALIKCKKGACVKWTHYVNNELILERTCSKRLNINIQLVDVCQTERDGNGYLCMCGSDLCNSASSLPGQTFAQFRRVRLREIDALLLVSLWLCIFSLFTRKH